MVKARARRRIIALAVVLLALAAPGLRAEPAPAEYELKAIFLFNFAKYVEWPAGDDETDEIGICVFGRDPFGRLLDDIVAGERVRDQPLAVRRISGPGETAGCRILFIDGSEDARLETVLQAVAGKGVLTVGESADFTERGGIVRLRDEGNRVRLDINVRSAEAAGLRISSQLLKLARIVGEAAE